MEREGKQHPHRNTQTETVKGAVKTQGSRRQRGSVAIHSPFMTVIVFSFSEKCVRRAGVYNEYFCVILRSVFMICVLLLM